MKKTGFTLVELMIVITIVGVLSSIALPAYLDYARSAKRATAQSDLMKLSIFLERRFTENSSYLIAETVTDPISSAVCGIAAGCTPSLTGVVAHDDYAYSLTAVTATAFTLRALPGSNQDQDKCGTMTLTDTGVRTPTSNNCWR